MMTNTTTENNTKDLMFYKRFKEFEEEDNTRAKKQRMKFSQKKLLSNAAEEMDMRMDATMDAMAELKLQDNGEEADLVIHTMCIHKLNAEVIQYNKEWAEIQRKTAIRKAKEAKEAFKEHDMMKAAKEAWDAFDEPLQSTSSLLLEHLRQENQRVSASPSTDSSFTDVPTDASALEKDDVVETLSRTINGVRNVFFRQALHHSTIGTTDAMKGGVKSLPKVDWWACATSSFAKPVTTPPIGTTDAMKGGVKSLPKVDW
jgi:hypothetical protein